MTMTTVRRRVVLLMAKSRNRANRQPRKRCRHGKMMIRQPPWPPTIIACQGIRRGRIMMRTRMKMRTMTCPSTYWPHLLPANDQLVGNCKTIPPIGGRNHQRRLQLPWPRRARKERGWWHLDSSARQWRLQDRPRRNRRPYRQRLRRSMPSLRWMPSAVAT